MNYRLPRASKQAANDLLNNFNYTLQPARDVSEDSSIDDENSSSESEDSVDAVGDSNSQNEPQPVTCTLSATSSDGRNYRRGNAKFPCPFLTQEYDGHDVEEAVSRGPYTQFKTYVTDDLFAYISDQTIMYSVERSGVSINTNPGEIEKIFAIWVYSGIFQPQVLAIPGLRKLAFNALLI